MAASPREVGCRFLGGLALVSYDANRALRVRNTVLADRAEQHPDEGAVPPASHNKELGTL